MSDLPPVISGISARLPATYEAAQKAIAECDRIDECKSWSDKAAALASYARQANDDSLRVMAVRIQARAERRCGELLKQIPNRSAANLAQHRQDGAVPSVTRTSAAEAAGLSERQRKTALRIASIPEPEFIRQVEGPTPPTVTRLAEQGRVTRSTPAGMAAPCTLDACSKGCEALAHFAQFCDRNEPVELARLVDAKEIEAVSRYVGIVDQWLDHFVTNLPKEGAP